MLVNRNIVDVKIFLFSTLDPIGYEFYCTFIYMYLFLLDTLVNESTNVLTTLQIHWPEGNCVHVMQQNILQ